MGRKEIRQNRDTNQDTGQEVDLVNLDLPVKTSSALVTIREIREWIPDLATDYSGSESVVEVIKLRDEADQKLAERGLIVRLPGLHALIV